MYEAASTIRSLTSSGDSMRGSIGSVTPTKTRCSAAVLGDQLQRAAAVRLARELDVQVARRASGTGRAGTRRSRRRRCASSRDRRRGSVHTDPLPLFLREAIEHQVVQRHPVAEELPGRVELQRQAALGEVDLHAVRALLERAADVGLALGHQVVDERLPWIPVDPALRVGQAEDRGAITACLTGTVA